MEQIIKKLSKDKLLHFIAGTGLFASAYLLAGDQAFAWFVVIVAAVGKEVYDRSTGRGTPEILDAVITIAGALPVAVTLMR